MGQIEASDAAARAALAMPGMQGLDRAQLLDSMVMNEGLAGHSQAALALAETAAALSAQLGDTYGVIRGMYRRGVFLLELGDLAGAVRELQCAAESCERYGFTSMLRGILYNLVCAYAAQTQPALMLATTQRGWALQPPLPPNDLRMMYRLAFVDAHLSLGELGQAWGNAFAAVDEAISLGTQLSLAATANTCSDLFAILGDQDCSTRLLAAISTDAMRQMPQMALGMWIARAQAALKRGDRGAARLALAQLPAPADIESPREYTRLCLVQAELALAEGDALRALALLPGADAPGMNDEMWLRALATRVSAEACRGELAAATLAAARTALNAEVVHAVAALALHHALAAAQRAGVAGVSADAQQACAAHVARLADSLRTHPVQQAAFLGAWST